MLPDLNLAHSEFFRRPVQPLLELGAYEALWDQNTTSFKTVSELFKTKLGVVPSRFVDSGTAIKCGRRILDILGKAGVSRLGIRVHGAGEVEAFVEILPDPNLDSN